jgi:hypothetical protein
VNDSVIIAIKLVLKGPANAPVPTTEGYMKTRFGWVELWDIRYDHDVIIHTDRTVEKRSKKKSRKFKDPYGRHTSLADYELVVVKKEKPDVVFIGTGQYGDLPITNESKKILSRYETVVLPTPDVLEAMEKELRPFVAVLHVTC